MTDFITFREFLDSLPTDSPVIPLHAAFNAAENDLMDLTSKATANNFTQAGTALRDHLEEFGFTSSALVKHYNNHIESSIGLAKALTNSKDAA